jgi:hypothetical protein
MMKTIYRVASLAVGIMLLVSVVAEAQTAVPKNEIFKHFGQTKTYAWPGSWGSEFKITFNKDGTFVASTGRGTWVAKNATEACLTYTGVPQRCDVYP